MEQSERITTCYGPVHKHIISRAGNIQLLICDVDGVLSDGLIYMGNNGEELKTFHVRDGYGIRCLKNAGIEVALITGRNAKLLEERARILEITYLYQGQSDKLPAYEELLAALALTHDKVAYIGDDLIDLPVMKKVGLSVAVADSHPLLLPNVHYVTKMTGGHGAVRELCDLILLAQGKLDGARGLSV